MASGNLVENQEDVLVTRVECEEIVRQTLNLDKVHIINYTIEAQGYGVNGFLGDYFRLVITIEENSNEKKLNYFLKSLPLDRHWRQLVEHSRFFYKEVQFYSILLPKLKRNTGSSKWRPNCYLSRDDILIMEDLGQLDYSHIPDRMEFTEKSIQEILKCLARMHASSLEFEMNHCENKRLDEIFDNIFFEGQIISDENLWFTVGLKAIQIYAERKSVFKDNPIVRDGLLMEKMKKVYELSETTSDFQNVLCHRDLWNKNIMFQFPVLDNEKLDYKNPKHCLLVDFQMYRYVPPAVDVLQAIYYNTRRRHREENLEKYLEFYYAFLQQELKKYDIDVTSKIPWDEFQRCRKHYKLLILILHCNLSPLFQVTPGLLKQTRKEDPDMYNGLFHVDRSDFIFENMDRDEYYKEYVIEIMEELLEYVCTNCE